MVALTGQINQVAIVFDLSGKYGMVINMDFSSIFKDARMPPVKKSMWFCLGKNRGCLNADEKCFSINQISALNHIQVHLQENLYGTVLRSIEGS